MLVSILMPAHNTQNFIAESIETVLAQTVPDFELLIVDDGSTDATLAVATGYAARDPRLRVFRRTNGGISAARNTALAEARGEWIALLDSDDGWLPHYLERQLMLAKRHPPAAIITANAHNRGGAQDGLPYWPSTSGTRSITLLDMIERPDSVFVMTMFRRSVVQSIGGFNEMLRSNEEYEFWLRAARTGFRFMANLEPCGWYRRRSGSVSADERRMLRGIVVVLKHVFDACPPGSAEHDAAARQIRRFQRELVAAEIKACLLSGELDKAAELVEVLCHEHHWPARLAAKLSRLWPRSLVLGYRCRRAIRTQRLGLRGRRPERAAHPVAVSMSL